MTELLNAGFIDTFRYFLSDKTGNTPGGPIGLMHERIMRDGALTIF